MNERVKTEIDRAYEIGVQAGRAQVIKEIELQNDHKNPFAIKVEHQNNSKKKGGS
jgi:hypothetical protein